MKKNLLFAGILLAALPVCAKDEPTRYSSDPEVIFSQDFEFEGTSLADWQKTIIGQIDSVQYYIHEKESGDNLGTKAKPWTDREKWQKGPWKDTTIILRNDVMVADNPIDSNAFRLDTKEIVNDYGTSAGDVRREQMSKYNRTGDKKYFKYVSTDTAGALSGTDVWSNNLAARYRRNLFIRGLDIQPYSSYRLTAYVTAHKDGKKALAADSVSLQYKPTMYFDIMRGHFSSEKPFTMGIENDAAHYKYNKKFEKDIVFESKDAKRAAYKEDEWSKVTFMTYYINDSIANDYVFVDGYWWDAKWSWKSEETGGKEWNYIVQPDKFFVRVGFASDSTTFGIDDISLTKSWIGGCEFAGKTLRVDFGYDTNIKDLCADAQEATGIAAIELDPQYFNVWGHWKSDGEWEDVIEEISSAEYHKDGYMYIFIDRASEFSFDDYDTVLVSFTNPDEESLRLRYNMSSVFPKAWDTAWIKDGCPVENFTNEVATANPIVDDGVYSMYDLPPVFKGGEDYEINSFQLDGGIEELKFRLSKFAAYDIAAGDATEQLLMMVSQSNVTEYWLVSDEVEETEGGDAIVTFARPTAVPARKFSDVLAGDYQIQIVQLYSAADPDDPSDKYGNEGQDVAFAYSFGDASMPEGVTDYVDFLPYNYDRQFTKGVNISGFSTSHCATRVGSFSGDYTRGLLWGVWGQSLGAQANADNRPKLQYKVEIPADGVYDFQFGMTMGDSYGSSSLYVYLFDEAGKKDTLTGYKTLSGSVTAPGTEYKVKPTKNVNMEADPNDVTEIENGIDEYKFFTSNLKAGTYTISFEMNVGDDNGQWWAPVATKNGMILYYLEVVPQGNEIKTGFGIAYGPMSTFSKAVAALEKTIAKAAADDDKYTGTTYSASVGVKDSYADFNVTEKVTAPSAWNAASAAISAADKALAARMALVDEMYAQRQILSDTLAYFAGLELTEMGSYKAGVAVAAAYKNVNASDITDDSIKAITKICQDAQTEMANQYKIIEPYRATLKAALDSVAGKYWVENDAYAALSQAVETAKKFNEVTSTSAEITAMSNSLLKALFQYVDVVSFDKVSKFNMAALDSLASKWYTFDGDKRQDIAELLATRQYNRLETFYKKAIKYAIYDKFVKGEDVDSLPVNALIMNNELWANVKVNDLNEGWNGQTKSRDSIGHNMLKVIHTGNGNKDVFIMPLGVEFTDLLPCWTVKSLALESGNRMTSVSSIDVYEDLRNKNFFNGSLALDWGSTTEVSQSLGDLPVGMYSIGANIKKNTDNIKFDVTADNKTNSITINKESGIKGIDSVFIAGGNASIKVTVTSNQGGQLDDFFMTFHADSTKNYEALAAAVLEELNEYATFDDAADEAEAQYEYYTLDAIKTDAPEGIVLRKNIATGEVEKVLFK